MTSPVGQTVCVSPGPTEGEFELRRQEVPSSASLESDVPGVPEGKVGSVKVSVKDLRYREHYRIQRLLECKLKSVHG